MLKYIFILYSSLLTIGLTSCSKSQNKCHYVSPPRSFFFLLKKNGNRLPDSILDNIRIAYMKNGSKLYITDLVRATGDGREMGILTTRLIGTLSADNNIKPFSIEYPDGTVDDLFIDYSPPSLSNNCVYIINQIKYNGLVSQPDPTITMQTVYTFIKP